MKPYLAKNILELLRVLTTLTFFIFIGVSQAYSLTYNLSLVYSYKFSCEDYVGNKTEWDTESDKLPGGMINIGFTRWGLFGYAI